MEHSTAGINQCSAQLWAWDALSAANEQMENIIMLSHGSSSSGSIKNTGSIRFFKINLLYSALQRKLLQWQAVTSQRWECWRPRATSATSFSASCLAKLREIKIREPCGWALATQVAPHGQYCCVQHCWCSLGRDEMWGEILTLMWTTSEL